MTHGKGRVPIIGSFASIKRLIREEDENVTIDNQSDRIYSLGVLFHCQLTRCPQGPMTL